MKVVIDTNVVISAVLKDRKPEEVILFIMQHPEFQWIASMAILEEYVDVLQRPKFDLPLRIVEKWQAVFDDAIMIVEVEEQVDLPRDPKDAPFLTCAHVTGAEYLVTGDKDFEEAYKLGKTTVLSVSQFLRLVCCK
jgi:putative PIN family toxin of toxin-antitoxin system